ncbi:MAG: HPr kinase/phosphorylase [Hyphomicrobiaceae bacterium]
MVASFELDVENWHATAIARQQSGVLFLGPSGSGKSDLALRCLALPTGPLLARRFALVSDDRTILRTAGDQIRLSPPQEFAGLIEVRGLGIVKLECSTAAVLRLVVRLTQAPVVRMPGPGELDENILGRPIRGLHLNPFDASAPIKVAIALNEAEMRPGGSYDEACDKVRGKVYVESDAQAGESTGETTGKRHD